MQKLDREFRALCLILAVDLGITLTEFGGSHESGSYLLWQNFWIGLFDALLITVNIWGLKQETLHHDRLARRISNWSDVMVALGMCFVAFRALGSMTNGKPVIVEAWVIPFVALFAAIVNGLCAQAVNPITTNLASARFKLQVGSAMGAATCVMGGLIWLTDLPVVDPGLTILFAVGVVAAVAKRLLKQRRLRQEVKQEIEVAKRH